MSTVVYVAIVEGSETEGYSAFFPDLPGCVTASDSMVELIADARDALALHLEGMIEDGDILPPPSVLEAIPHDPEVTEIGRLLVDAEIEDAPVRVNISIGAGLLKRVDTAAQVRGMTRSGLLAEAARQFMGRAVDGPGLREAPPAGFSED
ncbi:MAG: HicB family protein [Brevundimonas sp.]|nr:MAG: HicB family protein [Brevundimonas sp.]